MHKFWEMISDDESDPDFPMQRLDFLPFMQYLTFLQCQHIFLFSSMRMYANFTFHEAKFAITLKSTSAKHFLRSSLSIKSCHDLDRECRRMKWSLAQDSQYTGS